jgi:uncharacterized protein involved in exopolysaccharide biosynthesis
LTGFIPATNAYPAYLDRSALKTTRQTVTTPEHSYLDARTPLSASAEPVDAVDMLITLWRRKWRVAAGMLAGLVVAIIYLNTSTPTFTTELRVTAAASTTNSIANRLGSLGGLAAAAGLGISSSSKAEPFDLYLDALTSREVADRLAQDSRIMRTLFSAEWDRERMAWRNPGPSPVARLRSLLLIGNPPWRAPNGQRLRDYLQRTIVITKSNKSPITMIGYDARDPDFGVYLLSRMNAEADSQVRRRALRQAREYQSYLASVLPGVLLAEVRRSLADALTEQYQAVMMAQSNVSYAAVTVSAPQASTAPTKPKATIVIALGLLLGAVVGIFIAVVDFGGIAARARSSTATAYNS